MGLEPLFSWIPALFSFLLSWLPHGARLHVHEGGVKISGSNVVELSRKRRWSTLWLVPAWYWWVPRFSDIFTDNIKRKVIDLPDQLLTTKDRKRVRAGGVLVYHLQNVITWLVENEDPEDGVQVEAARVLREWVKARTFDEVQNYTAEKRSDDVLTRLGQDQLGADFGVRVRQLSLTCFAETAARDLYHSGIAGALGIPEATSDED